VYLQTTGECFDDSRDQSLTSRFFRDPFAKLRFVRTVKIIDKSELLVHKKGGIGDRVRATPSKPGKWEA
jgi:hypothetical protein